MHPRDADCQVDLPGLFAIVQSLEYLERVEVALEALWAHRPIDLHESPKCPERVCGTTLGLIALRKVR